MVTLPWVWGEPVTVVGAHVPEPLGVRVVTRSVSSAARPDMLFLWLCQLRRAPYSYDWIDNFGRRSPRSADPTLVDLNTGQDFMTIFALTDFVPGRLLTLGMKPGWPTRLFGGITLSYFVERLDDERCQLSAVMWMPSVGRFLAGPRRYLLAWGDLIMMRKQLLVLRALAEHEPTRGGDCNRGRRL